MKIGIVATQFNSVVVDALLHGAETALKEEKVEYDVVRVPGAFEVPLAAQRLAKAGEYNALIALGVVVKGDTDHYDMVCRACTDGIRGVMLKFDLPIVFEVLMVHDIELAKARASMTNLERNKGYGAGKLVVGLG